MAANDDTSSARPPFKCDGCGFHRYVHLEHRLVCASCGKPLSETLSISPSLTKVPKGTNG